jgi:hypothetical protein
MPTRRELISIAAALPAASQHEDRPEHSTAPAYRPKVFSVDELRLVAQLVDNIIPRTSTPGASDAGVHLLLDRALSARPADAKRFRAGIRRFAGISPEKQAGRLRTLAARSDPFFKMLKDLTIDGYYSTRAGLAEELGWHGYTPMPEFLGCTHPEHRG